MRREYFLKFGLSAVLLALAGCASVPGTPPPTVVSACLQQFQNLDARLSRAGLHDAGAYRIPGFPFLRSTRFTASFAHELQGRAQWHEWLSALRDEDQQAREHELRNLGLPDSARQAQVLAQCGEQLIGKLLDDDKRLMQLAARAEVPDDYSTLARILGAYPLAVPFLRQGVAGYQDEVRQNFSRPLRGDAIAYVPDAPSVDAKRLSRSLARAPRDTLGRPVLTSDMKAQLLRVHAPVWSVEVEGNADSPGRLVSNQERVMVVTDEAVLYTRIGHTRFADQVFLQLIYTLWFPARPHEGPVDPYAGDFDAVVWRVTLGNDGEPVAYDSIHACGCYHYFFPARDWPRRPQDDWWQEPVIHPQDNLPSPPLALRIQAGTHYLIRVLPRSAVRDVDTRRYRLQPYATLRSLEDAGGGHQSLFGADGLVADSERLERFWLWPTGVVSPGAMRQWGRHATAFVGRRHFDDARLLESFLSEPR